MTLCLAACFEGGVIIGADTGGQYLSRQGDLVIQIDRPMDSQAKLWPIGTHCVAAMAGSDAETLRSILSVQSVGAVDAREAGELVAQALRDGYPEGIEPKHDTDPKWQTLVAGRRGGAFEVCLLDSEYRMTCMPRGQESAIGSSDLARKLFSHLFFNRPLLPHAEALAGVHATAALSALFHGGGVIDGWWEWYTITKDGVSALERIDLDELRVKARSFMSSSALPGLLAAFRP